MDYIDYIDDIQEELRHLKIENNILLLLILKNKLHTEENTFTIILTKIAFNFSILIPVVYFLYITVNKTTIFSGSVIFYSIVFLSQICGLILSIQDIRFSNKKIKNINNFIKDVNNSINNI